VTVDEELTKLEDNLRRLKIEYESYFSGGAPRPPQDTLYRVEQTIKKFSSDAGKLNFSQRFRFNQLVQKHAVHNELWRKKLRDREEGRDSFSRRHIQEHKPEGPARVICEDPEREKEKVNALLSALVEAKRRVGESTDNIDPAAFQKFVREKTAQLKQALGCEKVQFTVAVEGGRVKFTAVKAE
jgi:hypothetical protein